MALILGQTVALPTTSVSDGSNTTALQGKQSELIVAELGGKVYTNNYRLTKFNANATGLTVPVITAGLVSVFTLFNPANSGINMELISVDYAQVVTATVINALGWYASTAAASAAGTFSTFGTVRAGVWQNPAIGKGQFLTAYTHSGTPTLMDIITGWGSTTGNQTTPINKFYDGRAIIPPGIAASIAMSTGAGTASAANIQVEWLEKPI